MQSVQARACNIRVMFHHAFGYVCMQASPLILQRDTRAWQLQVWISFGIAVFLGAVGLAWLPGEPLEQVFMVMGYVFCLSTVFALAKFVRDNAGSRRSMGVTHRCGRWWCGAASPSPWA